MPTELEELVDFLHHGNTQIRQVACESLVGFSSSRPTLFKRHQLLPVRDLKLLSRDYSPIAKNALTILINLSSDPEVLTCLAQDDSFLETIFMKLTNPNEPNANEFTMLLANLVKSDSFKRILSIERKAVPSVSSSKKVIDQLMDCFVKGAVGSVNPKADFDYLSYVFADLSRTEEGRAYFISKQEYDSVLPITKLVVFTEDASDIRRLGVASTIKNVAFEIASHPTLLSPDEVNLLPYILLPIMGPEEFSDEETAALLPDLQLLPPDKKRDDDNIITTHLETLLLLTTTRDGRDTMRKVQVYPVIRECHLNVENEEVREACDRLVQVLLRDEGEDEVGECEAAVTTTATEKAFPSTGVVSDNDDDDYDDDDERILEIP